MRGIFITASDTAQILLKLEKMAERMEALETESSELKSWKAAKEASEKQRLEDFANDITKYMTDRRATISEWLAVLDLLKHRHCSAYIDSQ